MRAHRQTLRCSGEHTCIRSFLTPDITAKMADVDQGSAAPTETSPALDALNTTDTNGTDAVNATVAKFVATPEGTALAYGSLVFMALLPIFFGALRSVSCSKTKVI